ncbi:MAG: hypothetical protein ROO71_08660 [Balneola sp.]
MKRRPLITILLALSCIVSAVILVATPSHKAIDYSAAENLDLLIASALSQEPSIASNFRRYDIEIDSNFTRTVYRVPVHPTFSKTMFHYSLHQTLSKLKIESPAKVLFPERDMNIYIYDNGTIRSTIRLITAKPKQESE